MRLAVKPGGTVILTAPVSARLIEINQFLESHALWLEKNVQRMSRFMALSVSGRRAYLKHKEEARVFVSTRVAHWNQTYGFKYNRIAIKNTKRIWGSCSRKGNLNFSYSLLFLPIELADYVVVHELCHLQEHNHGTGFWALVKRAIPEYTKRRTELRRYLPSR